MQASCWCLLQRLLACTYLWTYIRSSFFVLKNKTKHKTKENKTHTLLLGLTVDKIMHDLRLLYLKGVSPPGAGVETVRPRSKSSIATLPGDGNDHTHGLCEYTEGVCLCVHSIPVLPLYLIWSLTGLIKGLDAKEVWCWSFENVAQRCVTMTAIIGLYNNT